MAARRPYRSEPTGIFVMTMLWLTPRLFGPKSSEVIETAAANMKPELNPTRAVPIWSESSLPLEASKKNATGVGNSAIANQPVLAK